MEDVEGLGALQSESNSLKSFNSGKLCCNLCETSMEMTNDEYKPQFYVKDGGLAHHFRTSHHRPIFQDDLKTSEHLSRLFVEKETLQNIKKLSLVREAGLQSFIKCTVEVKKLPPTPSCLSDDHYRHSGLVNDIKILAKNERQAAKYVCLYLYHLDVIKSVELRDEPVELMVSSRDKVIVYSCWKAPAKFYLETTYCKLLRGIDQELIAKQSAIAENIHVLLDKVDFSFVPTDASTERKASVILQKILGFTGFRDGQFESIGVLRNNKDCIALLPTGGGKSVIFVVSAILSFGVTFVVEPTKFLMEEQVKRLQNLNLSAFFINSSLSSETISNIVTALGDLSMMYAIVFISPEWLRSKTVHDLVERLKEQNRIGFVAVDEAHCIDMWGGSFRSSYKELGFVKDLGIPVIALSGSATDHTVSVIKDALNLSNPEVIRTTFRRNNIFLNVLRKTLKPIQQVVNLVCNHHQGKCGIVFCITKNTVKDLAYALKIKGIPATFVHGEMATHERKRNEGLWNSDAVHVMCATKCFGMGIDKSNVEFVIVFGIPECIEDFYQQIGRAGRDGSSAICSLIYSLEDRFFHIRNMSDISDEDEKAFKVQALDKMTEFCISSSLCRHKTILNYFSEESEPCENNCDICTTPKHCDPVDVKKEGIIILNCFNQMRQKGGRVTSNLLLLTLLGSSANEIKLKSFDTVENYGAAKAFTMCKAKDGKSFTQRFIYNLVLKGVFREVIESMESYVRRKKTTITSVQLTLGNIGLCMKVNISTCIESYKVSCGLFFTWTFSGMCMIQLLGTVQNLLYSVARANTLFRKSSVLPKKTG